MLSCGVCNETVSAGKLHQFTPCLHVFCKHCMERWRAVCQIKSAGSRSSASPSRKTVLPVVCLASNCFSILDERCVRRLNWRRCESAFCSRQLPAVRLERLPCQHVVCETCMEEYKQTPNAVCPAGGCSIKKEEEEDFELCDGDCKKKLEEGKYVTTKCCQAKICFSCSETIFGHKPVPGHEESCPAECIRQLEIGESEPIARCRARRGCRNLAIHGFPSKGECDHTMCMHCLRQMIEYCESIDSLPHCPNERCSALYGTESVMAMRAMLPEKSSFFDKLSLDNAFYYTIRDETTTPILFSADFKSENRYFEINIKLSDDSESKKLPFDREGTVGDLVRELRRELAIAPEEKVYGYYLLQSSSSEQKPEEDGAGAPAKKLELSVQSVTETVGTLNLSAMSTIVVDTIGIVQAKNGAMLDGGVL